MGRTLNPFGQTAGRRGGSCRLAEEAPAAWGSAQGSRCVWADGLQERGSADLVSTNSIK